MLDSIAFALLQLHIAESVRIFANTQKTAVMSNDPKEVHRLTKRALDVVENMKELLLKQKAEMEILMKLNEAKSSNPSHN